MDYILQLDEKIFYILNASLTSSFLDSFMPFITTKANFVWPVLLISLLIFIAGGWKDRRALIVVVLTVLISDFTADFMKHLIQRVRPCNALHDVRILAGCSGSFSFPSGHATNAFAAAVFLSYIYRRYAPAFLFISIIIAYSRIYVGVHYPLDVIGGALVGSACALFVIGTEQKISPAVYLWVQKKAQAIMSSR